MAKRSRERSRRRRGTEDVENLDTTYLAAMQETSQNVADAPGGDEVADVATAADANRKQFGNLETAWMIVDVSEDGQEAVLTELSFGGDDSLTVDSVGEALKNLFFITTGLNTDLLEELAARAVAAPGSVINGQFPVARGVAPTAGEDGRVDLVFMNDLPEGSRLSTGLVSRIRG